MLLTELDGVLLLLSLSGASFESLLLVVNDRSEII